MTVFSIVVHHDPTCAWCYIHHFGLFSSISLFQRTYPSAKDDVFDIRFSPFYRDQNAPEIGVPCWDLMVQRNGRTQAEGIKKRMNRIGKSLGITFALGDGENGKQCVIGKTKKYQQVCHWIGLAKGPERQKQFVEKTYREFFQDGGDITQESFVIECALGVGLEEDEVREALRNEAYGTKVDELDALARKQGVKAVPTTVVNGVSVEGAEDASVFYELFAKFREGEQITAPETKGALCPA